MISIPHSLAAALGLKSGGLPTCELPEDELEGRMALAGLSSRSDVFNSPLLEGFVADAPDVFVAHVLSRLESGDLAMLATVNRKMRDVVFNAPVGDVRDVAAVRRELARVPNFVGSIGRLAWAKERGCPWDLSTFRCIVRGGNVEVARWAKERGCPWDEDTCADAAEGGHLKMLQWFRSNGAPWDTWTCTFAAEGGHLEVLQWARANGAPWDMWTCRVASLGGHLEVLQWARANGCPEFDDDSARANGCPESDPDRISFDSEFLRTHCFSDNDSTDSEDDDDSVDSEDDDDSVDSEDDDDSVDNEDDDDSVDSSTPGR